MPVGRPPSFKQLPYVVRSLLLPPWFPAAHSGTTRPMLREPQHGSWLNMAESELGVLASQCLDRRIADKQILAHEVNAWQDHRNKHHAKADWQFKTADARVKLKRLYPQFGCLARLAAAGVRL